MIMTSTRESEGANDDVLHDRLDLAAGSDELRRERRKEHVRRVAVSCAVVLALYLAAGAVFSSMGWNAWALLAGAWCVLAGFVALSD